MGISVSWYLYTESRFLAKHIGPGGDLPDLPYRTLTFSEKELTEVVSFICAKKNISGLVWGCHEFKTLDNINVRFGSENFTNIRNVIQKICSVSRIFQRKQSHMFESLQMKLRFFWNTHFPCIYQKNQSVQPIALILHLATKKEPSAMRPCTHKHDKFCSDCDQPFLLFEELKDLVEIGSDSVV